MNLFIRKALTSDVPVINDIVHMAFNEYAASVHMPDLPAMHDDEAFTLAEMRSKQCYIGFVNKTKAVGTVRYAAVGDTAYISRFAILPNWQQCGMGRALLKQVEQDCRAAGFKRLALHTCTRLTTQVQFYYANGFYIHSTEKSRGYIRGFFVKELTPDASDVETDFPELA